MTKCRVSHRKFKVDGVTTQMDLIAWEKLERATRPVVEAAERRLVPVIERLEDRWLMAGNPSSVQTVPFTLGFDGTGGGLTDANGVATGFTWVQPNVNGNEYQP